MADKEKKYFVPRMLLKCYSWDGINVNICNIRGKQELISVPYITEGWGSNSLIFSILIHYQQSTLHFLE